MKVRNIAMIAAITLALSACGGGGKKDPGFFRQIADPANPGFTLASLPAGEKISFRQHTGVVETRATGQDTLNFAWSANSSDENPAYLEILNPGLAINIRSIGQTVALDANLEGVAADNSDIALILVGGGLGLNYMDFGLWLASRPSIISRLEYGVGYLGLETPEDVVNGVTGTASYDGVFAGLYGSSGSGAQGLNGAAEGLVHLDVNFDLDNLTGSVTNIQVIGFDGELNPVIDGFNDIELSAGISGNGYTGEAKTGPAPLDSTIAFGEGLTGPLEGTFFGPANPLQPEETGGVLTIEDPVRDAVITGAYGALLN